MNRDRFLLFSGTLLAMLMLPVWIHQAGLTVMQIRQLGGLSALPGANDWSHYYASAVRLVEGRRVYCEPFTYSELGASEKPIPQATNPPLLVLLTGPFAFLPRFRAWALWNAAGIALAGIATVIVCRLFGFNRKSICLALGAIVINNAMVSNVMFSQAQALQFFLLAAYISLYSRNRLIASGVVLGLASALKLMALPLILFAVGARNLRTAVAAVATFACALGLTQFWPALWWGDYLGCASTVVTEWGLRSSCNLSLPFLVRNLAAVIFGSVGAVAWSEKFLVPGFFALSCLFVLLMGARTASVSASEEKRILPAALCGSILVWCQGLPLMWPHYYLFLWIPILAALAGAQRLRPLTGYLFALWLSFPLYPAFLETPWQLLPFQLRLQQSALVFLPAGICWLCSVGLFSSTRRAAIEHPSRAAASRLP